MKMHWQLIVLAAWLFAAPLQAQWKMAETPLQTPWAKDVTPDNVWPEYPRPQMAREQWTNLNGLWDYAIVEKDAAQPETWDGKILVPFCVQSALSGVKKPVSPDQALWYHRTFKTPDLDNSERLLLNFGAVDWHATVYLNGEKLGEHQGGYDPFTLDITENLRKDTNDLVVRVWDPTDKGYQPRGKQVLNPHGIWYTAVTGIWQTVWLEQVPKGHIRSVRIVPNMDTGQVTVTAQISEKPQFRVVCYVMDGSKVLAEKSGPGNRPFSVGIPKAKPWSPDDPHLYTLRITYGDDAVASYVGMRKIELKKDEQGVNRLFLNNKPLFQFGPLDQGWWPDGLYTPASDAALKYDIEVTRKLGMNMCRKHVKVEHARFYYWADKMGLLIWQDMPSGDKFAGRNKPDITRSAESAENFERELKAMIDTYRNHPSIVMWVPFNEGWGQWDTARICELIKKHDPTRLVNNASGWVDRNVGDVRDVHSYPGPASAPLEEDRAVVLGEFGGLGWPVPDHLWWDKKNWGYRNYKSREELNTNYLGLLAKLKPLIEKGLAAAVYTQTSDCEGEVNGLMTYDRQVVKLDIEPAAEAARKLYQ